MLLLLLLLVKSIRQTDFFAIFQVDKLHLRLASYVHIIFHQILTLSNFYPQLSKYAGILRKTPIRLPKIQTIIKDICKNVRKVRRCIGKVGSHHISKVSIMIRMETLRGKV